jgi:hypothetical protein
MSNITSQRDEFRYKVALEAFELIEQEIRPFIAEGGNLWTKGSRGYPTRMRKLLEKLDVDCPIGFATEEAMLLPVKERIVEHVLPMKRIVIEIIDPGQADPRSNTNKLPISAGPATSPTHLIEIFDILLEKCWVTKEEHERLNNAAKSMQWDAPNGNGWARYELANVIPYSLESKDN